MAKPNNFIATCCRSAGVRSLTRHGTTRLPDTAARVQQQARRCVRHARCPAIGLQVSLEIAVVANLLVDLQPVPLTVRDDHAVGGRIEFHRRRKAEPILRFEALYPASCLCHIRVGIDGLLAPLRQYLRVADQIADRPSLGIEDADPMVAQSVT